jgi:hypothetical protein
MDAWEEGTEFEPLAESERSKSHPAGPDNHESIRSHVLDSPFFHAILVNVQMGTRSGAMPLAFMAGTRPPLPGCPRIARGGVLSRRGERLIRRIDVSKGAEYEPENLAAVRSRSSWHA